MARQSIGRRKSFLFDALTAVMNTIVAPSTVNPGNMVIANAATTNPIGIATENNDTYGYASVQMDEIAQVIAGSNIVAGQRLACGANGYAVPVSPSASGTALHGVIGTALNSCLSGNLVDVDLTFGTAAA